MSLCFDNRMVVCAYYSTYVNDMIQYGHILDNKYNVKAFGTSALKAIYWNYDWFPNCLRFKLKMSNIDLTKKKSASIFFNKNSSMTYTNPSTNCFFLTVTDEELILTFDTFHFESKRNGQPYSIRVKHYQTDIFSSDKEFLDIALFLDSVIAEPKRKIDYGFYLNGIPYLRRELDANDTWSIDDIAPTKDHPSPAVGTGIYYGFFVNNMKARADLVYVMGCGLTNFVSSLNEGMAIYNMEISDIYYFSPAYFHTHVNGAFHNHARDGNGSSTVSVNGTHRSGSMVYTYPGVPIAFPKLEKSQKLNSFGGENFIVAFGGLFDYDRTQDVPTFSNHLGRIDYKLYKGTMPSNGNATGAKLRLSLAISVPDHTITLKVWTDTNTTSVPSKSYTGDLYQHANLKDHFDLLISYFHDEQRMTVSSKSFNKEPFADYYVADQHEIAAIEGFSWNDRAQCFHHIGDTSVTVPSSIIENVDKQIQITDFYAGGATSKLLKSRVFFCNKSTTEEISSIYMGVGTQDIRIKHNINYDSMTTKQKGLYTTAEANIIKGYTIDSVESLNPDKLTITHKSGDVYTLNSTTYGHYKIKAHSQQLELIAGFEAELDVTVTVIPTMTISFSTGVVNTGNSKNPACSVEVGQEFDIYLRTNMDYPPNQVQRNGLTIIREDAIVSSGTDKIFTYHVVPSNQRNYSVVMKYTRGVLNAPQEKTISVAVSTMRSDSNLQLYKSLSPRQAMTNVNTAIGDNPVEFFAVAENDAPPSIRTNPTSNVIIGRGDPYEITETVSGTSVTKYVYPLTISGIKVSQRTTVFVEYKQSKRYGADLKSFQVNVSDITVEGYVEVMDSAYAVFLNTSNDVWYLSRMLDSHGNIIFKQQIQVTDKVKETYKNKVSRTAIKGA